MPNDLFSPTLWYTKKLELQRAGGNATAFQRLKPRCPDVMRWGIQIMGGQKKTNWCQPRHSNVGNAGQSNLTIFTLLLHIHSLLCVNQRSHFILVVKGKK